MGKSKKFSAETFSNELMSKLDEDSLDRGESKQAYLDVLLQIRDDVAMRISGLKDEILNDEEEASRG